MLGRVVLLADDSLFLEHVAPPDHPERGERLIAVRAGLEAAAEAAQRTYTRLPLEDATDEQLARVHTPEYLAQLGHLAGQSGYLDADTFLSPRSVAAARRAAGGAVALVDALSAGSGVDRVGFALPRPPGHHAVANAAMGFCLLNNVAVAAAHARSLGYERVLVLDWDVHHGNGTQDMFFDDPAVLFVSLHQFPNYPGTGALTEQGAKDGRGYTVNLPLPKAGTDAVYAAAFERVVLPVVEQFRPTFALVSSGFDAHELDPLAEMKLSGAAYAAMTNSLLGALDPACPLGVVLEGGYDLEGLEESTRAVASVLWGGRVPAAAASASNMSPAHEHALAQIAAAQSAYWKLA
jgi:acetoin utilization deacetylase AcuC-like enzyme